MLPRRRVHAQGSRQCAKFLFAMLLYLLRADHLWLWFVPCQRLSLLILLFFFLCAPRTVLHPSPTSEDRSRAREPSKNLCLAAVAAVASFKANILVLAFIPKMTLPASDLCEDTCEIIQEAEWCFIGTCALCEVRHAGEKQQCPKVRRCKRKDSDDEGYCSNDAVC